VIGRKQTTTENIVKECKTSERPGGCVVTHSPLTPTASGALELDRGYHPFAGCCVDVVVRGIQSVNVEARCFIEKSGGNIIT